MIYPFKIQQQMSNLNQSLYSVLFLGCFVCSQPVKPIIKALVLMRILAEHTSLFLAWAPAVSGAPGAGSWASGLRGWKPNPELLLLGRLRWLAGPELSLSLSNRIQGLQWLQAQPSTQWNGSEAALIALGGRLLAEGAEIFPVISGALLWKASLLQTLELVVAVTL